MGTVLMWFGYFMLGIPLAQLKQKLDASTAQQEKAE